MNKTFYYKTEQLLPISSERAWNFFSSPENLTLITPPDLDFKVLTILENTEIFEGMIIEYQVKPLFGISVRWKTEICEVKKPFSFTDRQVEGPYKTWIHQHRFIEQENGLLMIDDVRYALPYGLIGTLSHSLLVRKKIEKIFDYRRQVLQKIFLRNEYNHN